MKRSILLVAVIPVFFFSCGPASDEPLFSVQKILLQNGLAVYLNTNATRDNALHIACRIRIPEEVYRRYRGYNLPLILEYAVNNTAEREIKRVIYSVEHETGSIFRADRNNNEVVFTINTINSSSQAALEWTANFIIFRNFLHSDIIRSQISYHNSDESSSLQSLLQQAARAADDANFVGFDYAVQDSRAPELISAILKQILCTQNIDLFLSGNFNPESMLPVLNSLFARVPSNPEGEYPSEFTWSESFRQPAQSIKHLFAGQRADWLPEHAVLWKYDFNSGTKNSDLVIHLLNHLCNNDSDAYPAWLIQHNCLYILTTNEFNPLAHRLNNLKKNDYSRLCASAAESLMNQSHDFYNRGSLYFFHVLPRKDFKLHDFSDISLSSFKKKLLRSQSEKHPFRIIKPSSSEIFKTPSSRIQRRNGFDIISADFVPEENRKIVFFLQPETYRNKYFHFFLKNFNTHLKKKRLNTKINVSYSYSRAEFSFPAHLCNDFITVYTHVIAEGIHQLTDLKNQTVTVTASLHNEWYNDFLFENYFIDYSEETIVRFSKFDYKSSFIFNQYLYASVLFLLTESEGNSMLTPVSAAQTEEIEKFEKLLSGFQLSIVNFIPAQLPSIPDSTCFALESYQNSKNKRVTILFSADSPNQFDFLYSSLIVSDIFSSGGWLSEFFKVKDHRSYSKINITYRRYENVQYHLVYEADKFFYIADIVLSPKYRKKEVCEMVRDIFYQRITDLQNANREDEEIMRTARKASADILMNYNQNVFTYFLSRSELGFQELLDNVMLLSMLNRSSFMSIASRFFNENQFSIVSDTSLTISMEEFFTRLNKQNSI